MGKNDPSRQENIRPAAGPGTHLVLIMALWGPYCLFSFILITLFNPFKGRVEKIRSESL